MVGRRASTPRWPRPSPHAPPSRGRRARRRRCDRCAGRTRPHPHLRRPPAIVAAARHAALPRRPAVLPRRLRKRCSSARGPHPASSIATGAAHGAAPARARGVRSHLCAAARSGDHRKCRTPTEQVRLPGRAPASPPAIARPNRHTARAPSTAQRLRPPPHPGRSATGSRVHGPARLQTRVRTHRGRATSWPVPARHHSSSQPASRTRPARGHRARCAHTSAG